MVFKWRCQYPYFHTSCKNRHNHLHISKIKTTGGDLLDYIEDIHSEAVNFLLLFSLILIPLPLPNLFAFSHTSWYLFLYVIIARLMWCLPWPKLKKLLSPRIVIVPLALMGFLVLILLIVGILSLLMSFMLSLIFGMGLLFLNLLPVLMLWWFLRLKTPLLSRILDLSIFVILSTKSLAKL